ncbi:hypothetical protein K470DRAFT_217922 [Piedraia hortae CBS 480.64]|uniref:Uncharacterized protein n=1 Tax=Piedraia hortae CBS 480.64 TaxID=1314780 RepID=A0A6A7BXJ7_9PEZI|nr:hypothetical protein K470DRAFT_217922 [Piedraia hortae CBS 480.64]
MTVPGTDDSIAALIGPAAKVGAACGTAGFLFGGTAGILKETTPALFATAAGIQTFALGSTFWLCRSTILRMRDGGNLQHGDYTASSILAGGISGALVASITRGRRNVLPATFMWSLIGGLGQITHDALFNSVEEPQAKESFWKRVAQSKWSPVRVMSDKEYADVLREKIVKLDAEISLVDDEIAALRRQEGEQAAAKKST